MPEKNEQIIELEQLSKNIGVQMHYIKMLSLFFFIGIISLSCRDNSFSPTLSETENSETFNNKETAKTTTESSTSIRYDDLPDIAAEYVVDGRKWDYTDLTYYFSNGTGDISEDQEQQAIEDAFNLWTDVSPLTFAEVGSASQADIVIKWATGSHGDGSAFDGMDGILAHAFYPPPNGSYAGDVHFDDAENWTLSERSSSNQPMDLVTVAAHELGHSLGLGHSQVQGSLMYPYYGGSHRYLAQDDIDGIQNLYGPPDSLDVYIGGPHGVNDGKTAFFTANISNAEGSVDYQWYYRQEPTTSWIADGSNSSGYSHTFRSAPGGETAHSAVKVEVSSAGETASDIHSVDVFGSGDCQTEPQSNAAGTNIIIPCE